MKDGTKFQYLDKGYVIKVGHFGDDRLIAKAARASFNADAYKSDQANARLIDYLIYHQHSSPLEMGNITFETKMPISVARQHMRHRTFKMNEQSLRYVIHDGDYYLPSLDRLAYQSSDNKQGSGKRMPEHIAQVKQDMMREAYDAQWKAYTRLIELEEKDGKTVSEGLAREVARNVLGTGFYTTLVWQADVRNLMHYLMLRLDSHAQWEIREHAEIVEQIFKECFPVTYEAFEENVLYAQKYSRTEDNYISDRLTPPCESQRKGFPRFDEFLKKLSPFK
jgi:thymidylate synthase (FAD)